ncbi:MAG: hypothetical protein ACRD5D_02410 [Candidatus Polarisedimenticolia bacterium]
MSVPIIERQDRLVVIDEIQRLPELLHEVHRLIEARGIRRRQDQNSREM